MAKVPEILVVDQDSRARYEIKALVKQASLTVAGESSFGTEAVSLASELTPDVIFCGVSNPPERSLQTIESLLDVLPETPIIAYDWKGGVETVRQAMVAGARNFLVMPAPPADIMDSVRSVLESEERKRLRLSGQTASMGARGMVITVFGAKGGVGKSTVAANLGVALASHLDQKVVVVDADNSFGDIAGMLDLQFERSIADMVRDVDTVDRNTVDDYLIQHSSGVWVLPAPREPLLWRSISPDRFRKAIALLSRRFDIVLVDTAGILTDVSLATLEESNMILWITSSDFSSINNSLLGLQTLQQLSFPENKVRLMLNVISSDDGVRPSKIEEALGREFFWTVPYDRQLRVGAQIGNPAVLAAPDSTGARSMLGLAQAITGITVYTPEKKRKTPVGRLLGRLTKSTTPAEGS